LSKGLIDANDHAIAERALGRLHGAATGSVLRCGNPLGEFPLMRADTVVDALGALAQEHRLALFRLLVQAGEEGKTAGAIAACYADTLVSRAADVTLKEGRPLILVVRETPLHLGHLRVLTALAEMGAVILPPMPAFYNRPKDLDDVVNHTVARVLDRLQLPQTLVGEWQGGHRRGPGAAGG